jgi:hypothetical protein
MGNRAYPWALLATNAGRALAIVVVTALVISAGAAGWKLHRYLWPTTEGKNLDDCNRIPKGTINYEWCRF